MFLMHAEFTVRLDDELIRSDIRVYVLILFYACESHQTEIGQFFEVSGNKILR